VNLSPFSYIFQRSLGARLSDNVDTYPASLVNA
jgi:hypothetical protein